MTRELPCILVYNPISGHGHLDSWNAMLIALLLARGWRVLALTPDVPATMSLLERHCPSLDNLEILDWEEPAGAGGDIWSMRSAWHRWNVFGNKYYQRLPGSEALPDMPFTLYMRRRIGQAVVHFAFRLSHLVHGKMQLLDYWKRKSIYTAKVTVHRAITSTAPLLGINYNLEAGLLDPLDFAMRLRRALARSNREPAIVFNMYVDIYRTDARRWRRFAAMHQLPWAGIRFVPRELPTEAYYTQPSLRGMCFLDQGVCRTYRARLPHKVFGYLPDITNADLPDRPTDLVREIEQRADGRKIVFMGGSIGGQKNIARWFEVIARADARKFFFVQVGQVHDGALTSADRAALATVRAGPVENFLLHPHYLPDERDFNDVIRISDVIFAAYRDFRISSNMLGKAAIFEKPILVSEGYLMGEHVLRYHIGATARQDDAEGMLQAIKKLVSSTIPSVNFAEFRADFGLAKMSEHLCAFLESCQG